MVLQLHRGHGGTGSGSAPRPWSLPGGSVTAPGWARAESASYRRSASEQEAERRARRPAPMKQGARQPQGRRRGAGGGRGSGPAAAEKLRLRHGSESASPGSRSNHIDGPKRKSIADRKGNLQGDFRQFLAFLQAVGRQDASGGEEAGRREAGLGSGAWPARGSGAARHRKRLCGREPACHRERQWLPRPRPPGPQVLKGCALPRGGSPRSRVVPPCGRDALVLYVRELWLWNREDMLAACDFSGLCTSHSPLMRLSWDRKRFCHFFFL